MQQRFKSMLTKGSYIATVVLMTAVTMIGTGNLEACTRAVYIGTSNMVITGRTMDWGEDIYSNAWVFPQGMARDGAPGIKNGIQWTSKYGSLVVSGYESGTADGMNEAGLVANLLYLSESEYGDNQSGEKPILTIAAWAQYVLDNFGSVAETVKGLQVEPFHIIAPKLPNGRGAQLHLSISDPSGDSAVFEYIKEKLVIHHGSEYRVMTNSPRYDEQIAIQAYWKNINGMNFLPGTINAVPNATYENQAIASVMSVMRSIGVPLGITNPDKPNLSSTLWRTAYDHKNKVFYFDSATSPNTFWVPLSDLDFRKGAAVKKLTIAGGKVYAGNAASKFEPAEPFKFLSVDAK
jgi:choloylglycine hydrolase